MRFFKKILPLKLETWIIFTRYICKVNLIQYHHWNTVPQYHHWNSSQNMTSEIKMKKVRMTFSFGLVRIFNLNLLNEYYNILKQMWHTMYWNLSNYYYKLYLPNISFGQIMHQLNFLRHTNERESSLLINIPYYVNMYN